MWELGYRCQLALWQWLCQHWSLRPVTFEKFDLSDEETWPDKNFDNWHLFKIYDSFGIFGNLWQFLTNSWRLTIFDIIDNFLHLLIFFDIFFLYIFISSGTVHILEHWKILLDGCDIYQHVTGSLLELPWESPTRQVRTVGRRPRHGVGIEACPAVRRLEGRWWWWRGSRWRGINLPDLTLTFFHASALAVQLTEGGPGAGLPLHNLDQAGSWSSRCWGWRRRRRWWWWYTGISWYRRGLLGKKWKK